MSQLQNLAQAVVEMGKQSGPVLRAVLEAERVAGRVAVEIPSHDYSRAIRTDLYEAIAALRAAGRLLTEFDKQAETFARRLVDGPAAWERGESPTAIDGSDPAVGRSTPSGREFLEDDEANRWLKAQAAAMPAQPGQYIATMHGSADFVMIDGARADAAALAAVIRADGSWRGQPVLLLACFTGARADGFAQKLATLLGVPVSAPTGMVSFHGDPPRPVAVGPVNGPLGRTLLPNRHFVTFQP